MTAAPRRRRRWRSLAGAVLRSDRHGLVDGALVAIRAALAWIFIYYGAGKLFGAFGGPGLAATSTFFAHVAHLRPGGLFAAVAGVIEFAGGIAMALGLAARVAGLALVGDQVVAIATVTWANGLGTSGTGQGYGFNVALIALGLVVVLLGGGRASLDHHLAKRLRANGEAAAA